MKNKKLDHIKSTGFKTPKNYFESLDDTILELTLKDEKSKVIQLFSKRHLVYISGIAAAVLLLFNLSIFDSTPTFDDLETETVENYLIDENITSYEIAALLSDNQIEEDITVDLNLDGDYIEEYLLNNADIELLMIE